MHGDAKRWDSSRMWCAHSAPMEDNRNYIQYLFGPGQSDSGLLSSRGVIKFYHPHYGHKFASLSFPRTSCQLNTCIPPHPAEILFPRWEGGQISFLLLPPLWLHSLRFQQRLRETGGGRSRQGQPSHGTAALQDLCPRSGLLCSESSRTADTYTWSQP